MQIIRRFSAAALLIAVTGFAMPGCTEQSALGDSSQTPSNPLDALTVYKTPTCGCCDLWVDHVEDKGFTVTVKEMDDLTEIKRSNGIKPSHQSCHTAVDEEGGYVFEGHIPAKYITAFLANPPAGARGLVVPGMPLGSPGMEYENRFSPYDILLLDEDGSYTVFAHVGSAQDQDAG